MVNEYHLKTPLSDDIINKLNIGDIVYISGIMVTARDEAHEMALELLDKGEKLPLDLKGLVLYHCGPVAIKKDNKWSIVAAGPTTSMRMESVEYKFIEKTGIKMVVGKGGMGKKTADAMKKYNAVYAVFTGGAGALAAERIKEVKDVYWLDKLGIPEAMWVFRVEEFGPLIITIDNKGNNYYERRLKEVANNAEKIKDELMQYKWT
ncbi:hydro-lyase family enzyme, Fe-S type, tartrate/fumarate subfamily [Caldisphaera lagunensis DSM 15908]|uniref:Hydro-lyase family enzyme, Fe-S type, tartrate/fumarate subfamily n=1 Tax=Caldisphaera lagunensis (strain DSM 15908 / JCM 11604 / ANMR 0165 / IC-154) TaxID=1056495 RepID=L0A9T5_CALLD|nr:FumA C-terminus/TtdB family hydratase beta subunit [Caldisphaera lagunensis]AFZ70611.1 hydro-lyase family enzyme, Fe-S type, tartrate/fumarate subfamily [Caldisphaera lagunensis DSM 15908]